MTKNKFMEEVLLTFCHGEGIITQGSHRSSNGFVQSGYEYECIQQAFSNNDLSFFSWHDSLRAMLIVERFFYSKKGETYTDTCDWWNKTWIGVDECVETLNSVFSAKYGVRFKSTCNKELCEYDAIECLDKISYKLRSQINDIDDDWEKYKINIRKPITPYEEDLKKLYSQISDIKIRIENWEKQNQNKFSEEAMYKFYSNKLHDIVKKGIDSNFDLTQPICSFGQTEDKDRYGIKLYSCIYALDTAFVTDDAEFALHLLEQGYFKCSTIPLEWGWHQEFYDKDDKFEFLAGLAFLKNIASYEPLYDFLKQNFGSVKGKHRLLRSEVELAIETIIYIKDYDIDFSQIGKPLSAFGIIFTKEELLRIYVILYESIRWDDLYRRERKLFFKAYANWSKLNAIIAKGDL